MNTGTNPSVPATDHAVGEFPLTHWSQVLAAAETAGPGATGALEKLCRAYWPAIYAHVRRQGHNPEDARDLTQEFFAHFLEKKSFKLADPARGRFRSFLLSSLDNFLKGEWRKQQAKKRGGGRQWIPLETMLETETRLVAEPIELSATPDQAFEKRWALTLLEQVLSRLRAEFTATGPPTHFDAIKVFVWGNPGNDSQVEVAARLGISPNTLGVTVHRLRRRFGELLREEIAETVASPMEMEDELRHLMQVLGVLTDAAADVTPVVDGSIEPPESEVQNVETVPSRRVYSAGRDTRRYKKDCCRLYRTSWILRRKK